MTPPATERRSLSLQADLIQARERQGRYVPSKTLLEQLGRRTTLLACIGISQIGKSTIMQRAEELTAGADVPVRIKRIGGHSTRQARPNDDQALYSFAPAHLPRDTVFKETLARIEKRAVAQYFIPPGDDPDIYWTEIDDYPPDPTGQTLAIKDIFPHALPNFEQLFPNTQRLYVVRDNGEWAHAFATAFPTENERVRRAEEAIDSLEWALDHKAASIRWLINERPPSSDTGLNMSINPAFVAPPARRLPGETAAHTLIEMATRGFGEQDTAYARRARMMAQQALYTARTFLPFAQHKALGVTVKTSGLPHHLRGNR